ncbi:MAG: DUF922 domain-containing protein, partial [Pseudomonadota bacterium]
MPSQLVGLRYAVTWSDFQGNVPADAAHTAHIDTKMKLNYGWKSKGGSYSLADNVVVTVLLSRQKSWAKAAERTAALLAHEQRHYDITALMARDCFIELMGMKGQGFPSQAALEKAVATVVAAYPIQTIQERYDDETNHSQIGAQQTRWDCMIQRAFTQARTPAKTAPDGTVYKIPLLTVLAGSNAACA